MKTSSLFILASPRTGSTLIYQVLANLFDFVYFSNIINDKFYDNPYKGFINTFDKHSKKVKNISYKSTFGKTTGQTAPSEASYVFRNWFGGLHPSQTESRYCISGKKEHMISSFEKIVEYSEMPILVKNAWNCFRIEEISNSLVDSKFIWLRRDLARSAFSDLKAKYIQGDIYKWNSATVANYKDIQKRPYWEQVVEQQYEYNKSIEQDLKKYASDRHIEIWFEDFCENLQEELSKIESLSFKRNCNPVSVITNPPLIFDIPELERDYERICNYIELNNEKFKNFIK